MGHGRRHVPEIVLHLDACGYGDPASGPYAGVRNPLHPLWRELQAYVGMPRFRWDWVTGTDAKVHEARQRYPSSAMFYRESPVYLYHNLAFFLEGVKIPYYQHLFARTTPPCTVLDYGCGSGYDGLLFQEVGYRCSFADVPSAPLTFLGVRERAQADPCPIYTLPSAAIPHHDVVWCVDVLEHLPPWEHRPLLARLLHLGSWVFVTLVHDVTADGLVHYPVDVPGLTTWLCTNWPAEYIDYYPQPSGSFVRLCVVSPLLQARPGVLPSAYLLTAGESSNV